jgi:quercetin dioxygenase-like cupin family protein
MRYAVPLCALLALGSLADPVDAQVLTMPLPPLPTNQEMRILEIDLAPGQTSRPHRHDAHVFVYVLEGRVHMQVEGGERMTLSRGETFYEAPGDVHTVSDNASATEPARILVYMIRTAGTPVSVPASD